MKLGDINTSNSTSDCPCDLVAQYMLHEEQGGNMYTFLSQFDFESREEIAKAVRDVAFAIAGDRFLSNKRTQDNIIRAKCLHKRYCSVLTNPDKFDKYPTAMSGELWHGSYCRIRTEQRTAAFFRSYTPTTTEWENAVEKIKRIYGLTDIDIDKLMFFVEQVKAGKNFPNSLRRMLYIWGNTKMTGKTTTATMIVSILNGDKCYNNIAKYSTSLAYEMQIKSFAVPKISECNVCLMDECFYADMGKTYADFKRFITSSGGTARLPFGQEFRWEGYPNYVATSNDPLKRFIKDWDDRRYLSIEFKKKPTEKLEFDTIFELWRIFIIGSRRILDWAEWADRIAVTANEIGERTERCNEFEIELKRSAFLDYLQAQTCMNDRPSSSDNHIALKFFVDYFAGAIGAQEAQKRREEIEQAVLKVFGKRYSTQTYWLLSELKKRGADIKREILYGEQADERLDDDDLEF